MMSAKTKVIKLIRSFKKNCRLVQLIVMKYKLTYKPIGDSSSGGCVPITSAIATNSTLKSH